MPAAAPTQFLYRIIRFDRLVQMLKTDDWYFAHPRTWKDPYEIRIHNKLSDELFAQCWCRRGVSDAMWRIYSQDKLGVRIRVSLESLRGELTRLTRGGTIGFRIGRLKYVNEIEYLVHTDKIKLDLQRNVTFARASAHLFLKRRAFDHEEGTRIVVCNFGQPPHAEPDSLKLHLNTRKLIHSVLVDPRAPDEYVDAYRKYLKEALSYSGSVKKSLLYKSNEVRES